VTFWAIELLLTAECNRACVPCNRFCPTAPSTDCMTPAQVETFLSETSAAGVRWSLICLTGGEPALHPEFLRIVELLRHSRTQLAVRTAGYGEQVHDTLAQLPPEVHLWWAPKLPGVQKHFFNALVAPADLKMYQRTDFSQGCSEPERCGLGLSWAGYYPCANAAGIDRVVGLDLGRQKLPVSDWRMPELRRAFCGLCGCFRHRERAVPLTEQSSSWQQALAAFKARPPVLTRYGGCSCG
jgi:hypothetical protein